MAERTYSEREIRALLERAAERLEAARRAADAAGAGLTLDELQAVAAAAGIAPEHVAAAAAEQAGRRARGGTFLGAPTEVRVVRVLPGPVGDEAWAALVEEARETFGESGMAGQVGPVREWTRVGGGGRRSDLVTRLAVEPGPAGTRLVLTQSARDVAFGLSVAGGAMSVMALVFGVLVALGASADLGGAAAFMAVMALLLLLGTQAGMRAWERTQTRRFDRVMDRFELLARDARPADVTAPRTADRRPLLDLDAEAPAEERTRAGRRSRTR